MSEFISQLQILTLEGSKDGSNNQATDFFMETWVTLQAPASAQPWPPRDSSDWASLSGYICSFLHLSSSNNFFLMFEIQSSPTKVVPICFPSVVSQKPLEKSAKTQQPSSVQPCSCFCFKITAISGFSSLECSELR